MIEYFSKEVKSYRKDIQDLIERRYEEKRKKIDESYERAIKELDIKKISLATPYIEELNRKEKEFLEANGIKVLKMVGLGIRENIKIGRVKPETVYNLALKANIKNSDGLLISCTNLRTIEVIERLEEELKKPVISSNTATLWNMLKKVNYRKKISGYGTLLSKL